MVRALELHGNFDSVTAVFEGVDGVGFFGRGLGRRFTLFSHNFFHCTLYFLDVALNDELLWDFSVFNKLTLVVLIESEHATGVSSVCHA